MKNLLRVFVLVSLLLVVVGASSAFSAMLYQETYVSATGSQSVAILVNYNIYDAIYQASLKQYIADLEAEDYRVTVVKVTTPLCYPQEIKDYLKQLYSSSRGLKGVLFVGDFSSAYFEISNDYKKYGFVRFPIDLFFMDLDGTWQSANNFFYTTHTGNLFPEIWVGRIVASANKNPTMDQVALLKNYFAKNHAYRTGTLPVKIRQCALGYIDDDWTAASYNYALNRAYPNSSVTYITNKATTNAADYKNRLKENYEWIHVFVHSSTVYHNFKIKGNFEIPQVSRYDIQAIDPMALFYNLFACSNCLYTANCMGNEYILAKTNGLLAVGSTKTGAMDHPANFYDRIGLNSRQNMGEGLKGWFSNFDLSNFNTRCWFYGMTILGDPTLTLDPPIASITSNVSSSLMVGQAVSLSGSGKITSGSITAYSWRSSINGFLNSGSSFSTTALKLGTHDIFFKVKDSKGRWSSEAKFTLTVR